MPEQVHMFEYDAQNEPVDTVTVQERRTKGKTGIRKAKLPLQMKWGFCSNYHILDANGVTIAEVGSLDTAQWIIHCANHGLGLTK